MTRTTVRLPEPLLTEAKGVAQRTGRTFTQLLEDAVRAELNSQGRAGRVMERSPGYETARPRASTAELAEAAQETTAEERERTARHMLAQVREIQAFLAALPVLDHRTPDEILGYAADGIPE